jgi:hypothetical protein
MCRRALREPTRPVRNGIEEVDHIDWTYAASASKSAAFRPEA